MFGIYQTYNKDVDNKNNENISKTRKTSDSATGEDSTDDHGGSMRITNDDENEFEVVPLINES